MKAVWKPFPYRQPIDGGGHIILTTPELTSWQLYAEVLGGSVDSIIIHALHKPLSRSERELSNRILDPKPAEYTLALTMNRLNRYTGQKDKNVYHFSGVIKPGGYFRVRITAFIELLKGTDGNAYNISFNADLRCRRSLEVENYNTATQALNIGLYLFEFVSKEILALHSKYFETLFNDNDSNSDLMIPLAFDDKESELAISMMLEWVQYKKLRRVTPMNAYQLISVFIRFKIRDINKQLDEHLALYCRRSGDSNMLDAAILLCQKVTLPETENCVPFLYGSSTGVREAFDRLRGVLSMKNLERLFDAYRGASKQDLLNDCSHVYFKFASGRAFVKLNRVGLPMTTAALASNFSPAPHFYKDDKNRYISSEPVPNDLRLQGEHATRKSVPSDGWAFLIRTRQEGPRLMLTKSRPEGLYLGFVVEGSKNVDKHTECLRAGLYYET